MTDEPDDEKICINCLADRVSTEVLNTFTDQCPDVKMSWDDWMFLSFTIEEKIKEALGMPVEVEEADEAPRLQ